MGKFKGMASVCRVWGLVCHNTSNFKWTRDRLLRRTRQTNLSFSLNGTLWHWKPSLSTPFCLPFTTRELPFTSSSLNHFLWRLPQLQWLHLFLAYRYSGPTGLSDVEVTNPWGNKRYPKHDSNQCQSGSSPKVRESCASSANVFQPIQSCFEIWRQDLHRKHFQVQVALYNPSSLQVSEIHSLPPERERCNHCN